ncbi:serine hydrolase [Stieleria sp. TO1_6]|uniref:serine hydrolase n=1 Tax=Stieleria tagensis TaxID=2956795 RepID=UPI00209B1406|nr:serine hydrolase [Stieleria tagensis]MCO8120623.1 serine hydrolase [Stieleria tagensis]
MNYPLQHCLLTTGVLLGLCCVPADAQTEESSPVIDYQPAIDRLRTAVAYEVEQKQLPAFSISVVAENRVVWADGFGFQDSDRGVRATENTVYRVGSISKLFTDIAVMQLVESGKLDLNLPVQTYLPEFHPQNPFGTAITLRELMTHTSGLVRESPIGNYFDASQPTLDETVASLNETTLVYEPGTKTKYSNAALAVVGSVLESQLDQTHPERVRETILEPLQMSDSDFIASAKSESLRASGWMWTYDGRRFVAPEFLLGTGPAGNLYSSVADLSKFLLWLLGGNDIDGTNLLKPQTLTQMKTAVKNRDGNSTGYGLGFRIQDLDGYTKLGHGGAVYGFSTQLEALPERQLGVAAIASLDGSNGVVSRLSDYALRLMIASQDQQPLPEYQTTSAIPQSRADQIVGSYRQVDGDQQVHVNELDGRVYLQRGVFRYRLRTSHDGAALVTDDVLGYGTRVEMKGGDQLTIGDTDYVRLPDNPPNSIDDSWKGLIGEYGPDHNTLYILEKDNQLYALIEWFYYYPLKKVSRDTYAFPETGLYHGEQLKFSRGENAVATQVVAAEVTFTRRDVGTREGETFKITPVKPIAELRQQALEASPPKESGDFRDADLVDLVSIDPSIRLDIRYATDNNFTGAVFYKQPRALMQRPAAEAVARVNARLKSRGLGLVVYDAYRPWYVTKMFWDATPQDLKDFVADPQRGSRHNRGCAVDLGLYDLDTGAPIPMVAGYDEFSQRSFPLYPGGSSRQRWYRDLLRQNMQLEGFAVYEYEWWHFDYQDWKKYRIGNVTFDQVSANDGERLDESDPFVNYDRSMRQFLRRHGVPGASIAVTDGGRLVLARGYGLADLGTNEAVEPDSLFRIASLSKPITAVAIMQLVERGELHLEDTVIETLQLDQSLASIENADPRVSQITIGQLLEHRGGWDRDQSFDPMFQSIRWAKLAGVDAPAEPATVIQCMLSQPLDFDPGQRYAYSNFGYCLLGRVIEKVSGQSYESYVQENVLAPIGVTGMKIGATHLAGRTEGEVRYYHPEKGRSVFQSELGDEVLTPYGAWYLQAMDSHGGWIASASDLAKFAAAFDDPDHCPILLRQSIERMYQRPSGGAGFDSEGAPKKRFYSLGWSNRVVSQGQLNHWHTGSLPGTLTIMIRRHDGKNFVALLNTRVSSANANLGSELDRMLHQMADAVEHWPSEATSTKPAPPSTVKLQ